uniref:Uncharacterized protein n=1 Tax=Meloidogyne enterolobii TaxID=390850 RepID=A0A6V7WDZ7_MELEN|nr:unnamed protein product [Meloidogyne enterolobii]
MSAEMRVLDNKYSKQNDLSKMDKSELIQLHVTLQTRLNKLEDTNIDLRAQLLSVTEERDAFERETLTGANLKQIQEQIKQKDLKIDEMNNLILAKERQIIDLQEMCTEQGQVAHSKSLAIHIVNRRLQELDAKQVNDVATETTDLLDISGTNSTPESLRRSRSRSPHRSSPGRAFPQFRIGGNSSPPPVDPAEDGCSSYTTETQQNLDGTFKKKRKKVNFNIDINKNDGNDFSPPQVQSPIKKQQIPSSDYEELITENDHLRQIIREMEEALQFANKTAKPESMTVLKVKAVAQAKIRELEGMLSQKGTNKEEEIAELKAVIEQLKDSREWVLSENSKLQDQLECSKQKCSDLVEEMDSSLKTTDLFRKKLDDNIRKMDATIAELYQTRAQVRQVVDEKAILTSEIERLKEAIFAQDEFIGVLEGDLLVYEAHVGILRDSIGASKKEDRQYIKSKAFSAKINALEAEKEEICRKNNEEKLRAKAFAVKIRCLEQERDELKLALRQYEGGSSKQPKRSLSAGISNNSQDNFKEYTSVSTMTIDDDSVNQNEDILQSEQQQQLYYNQLLEKTEENENLLIQISEQKQQNELILTSQNKFLSDLEKMLIFILKLNNDDIEEEGIFGNEEERDLPNIDDIYSNFLQKTLKIKNIFESTRNELNEVQQYNDTLFDQIETLKEENDLFKCKYEQQEETKLKIEFELKSLWQKYTENLNLLDNSNKTIKEFEEKVVNLSNELTSKKNEILELETENKVLEEEKASLKQNINSIEQLVGSLRRENASLQNKIVELNEKLASLTLKLNEEKSRLEKLVNLLNSIVDKFKSNVVNLTTLDEFINEGIENCKNEEEKEFRGEEKGEDLQNNNIVVEQLENEITNLKIQLATAEALAEDLLNQKSALEIEKNLLISERNNLLNLQNELVEYQNKNEKLSQELDKLNKNVKENDKINRISVNFDDLQTQTELIKICHKNVQAEKVEHLIDAQIQCDEDNKIEMKTIGVETDGFVEEKILFKDVAVGEDKIIAEDDDETVNQEKFNLIQQQSHQLLKECIQDRQEFERDMDINVQQLLELKNSLETSVEILKGEVWALNEEIKKRFSEQNVLKNSLEQVGNLVKQLRSENDKLTLEVEERNGELIELKIKLEYYEENEKVMEKENMNLCSSIETEMNKNEKLTKLLINFNEKNAKEMSLLRYELQQLKEAQIETKNLADFKQLFEYLKQIKEHKCGRNHLHDCTTKLALLSSNLTIKNRDNEALVRENNELIETNAKLQNELDEILLRIKEENEKEENLTDKIEKEEENNITTPFELNKDFGGGSNFEVDKTFDLSENEKVNSEIIEFSSSNKNKIINEVIEEEEKKLFEENLWNCDEDENNNEEENIVDNENKQDLNEDNNNDWGWNDEENEEEEGNNDVDDQNKVEKVENKFKKEENDLLLNNKEEEDTKINKNEEIGDEQTELEEGDDDWAWNDDDNDHQISSKMTDNISVNTDQQHNSNLNQKANNEQKDVKSLFDDWGDF